MKPLFLFVRPPRPMWPFNGPTTAFWPPLAFASMAAALRHHVPQLRVAILDAPALSMGWTTLTQQLHLLRPTFLGIGEEAVSCVEGLRIARIAKDLGARVIAGGCFFSNVAPELLATGLVDVVVHSEGEHTIVELAQALLDSNPATLHSVRGISFLHDDRTIFTGPRPLIANLDDLPLPAWDLLPMENYGARSRRHPRFAAIELGRGCSHACNFCVLWRQMGHFHADRVVPCHRVKSPERVLEEVCILMDRFDRRYLGWVDPCFNAHPSTPARVAELLLHENRILGQSAWLRADYLLRDHDSGALPMLSRSGWNEAYLGIERLDPVELARMGKGNLHHEVTHALHMLRRFYPDVVTFGSLIYGLPHDNPQTVRALFRSAQRLPVDSLFFIPCTPLPGTPFWQKQMWDPTGQRFRAFDFIPRSGSGDALAPLSAEIARNYVFHWPAHRVGAFFRNMFSRNARRRGITWSMLRRSAPLMFRVARPARTSPATGMIYPAWYES